MKSLEESLAESKSKETITVSKADRLEKLEEKIDKILKYQKHTRNLILIRGIISFIFFLIIIVGPIIGTYYLWDFIKANVDLGQLTEQYQNLTSGLGQLDQLGGGIGDILNQITGGAGAEAPAQ